MDRLPAVKKYVAAFNKVQMTPKQIEMLRAHYHSPEHTITASQLAKAVGFAHYHSANLQYGKLAQRLCNELGHRRTSKDAVSVLAWAYKHKPRQHFQLVLHKNVVTALEEVGLVRQRSFVLTWNPNPKDDWGWE